MHSEPLGFGSIRDTMEQYRCGEEEDEVFLVRARAIVGAGPVSDEHYLSVMAEEAYCTQALAYIRKKGEAQFKGVIKKEQKRRQPYAKTQFKPLPEEVQERLKVGMVPWMELCAFVTTTRGQLGAELFFMAEYLDYTRPLPHTLQVVDTCSSYVYSNQGMGACRYAKKSLEVYVKLLRDNGFIAGVVNGRTWTNNHPGWYGRSSSTTAGAEYRLFANIEPWRYQALKTQVNIGAQARYMAEIGIHPQVVMPLAYKNPEVSDPKWHGTEGSWKLNKESA